MHEIHRSDLVDRFRHGQGVWLLPHQPLLRLDTQVQFQFAVDPIHALAITAEAIDIAQKQKTQPKAPAALVVGQPHQPVGNLGITLQDASAGTGSRSR